MAPYGPEDDAQPMPWESPGPPGPYPVPDPASLDFTGGGNPGPGDADFTLTPWVTQPPPDIAAIAQGAAGAQPWDPAAPHVAIGIPQASPTTPGANHPPDPLPPETAPVDPTVAAYEPGADRQPWDAAPAPGGVEPGLAGSETFAPDRAPTPELAAAEQAWAAEQAGQGRIDAQAAAYDRLDPVAFADMQAKRQMKLDSERATQELAAADADQQALKDNIKRREQARAMAQRDMAEVTTAARDMADGSPFANWWADRSVPQKFTGILATVFAGLDNPHGGNSALDTFMGLAKDDADQKWKKLEARRGLAQDAMGNADDDYKMRESIRLASMLQVQRGIEQALGRLDPEGSAAMKLSEVHRGVAGQLAKAAQDLEELRFGRADKMIKADQEQQRIDIEAARENRLAGRGGVGGGAAGGIGGPGAAGTGAINPDTWVAYGNGNEKLRPPWAMDPKQYKSWLDVQLKAGNINESDARAANVGQSKAFAEEAATIHDPMTGEPLGVQPDDALKKIVDAKLTATAQAAQVIDTIIRVARESGGNSDVRKNTSWQIITSSKGVLDQLVRAGFTMGALDAGAIAAMGKIEGGVDPNSFIYDAVPGLKNLRKQLLLGTNLSLKSAGIKKPWTVPDLSAPRHGSADKDLRAIVAEPPANAPAGGHDIIGGAIGAANRLVGEPDAGTSTAVKGAKLAIRAMPGVGMLAGGSPFGIAGEAAHAIKGLFDSHNVADDRSTAIRNLTVKILAGGDDAAAAVQGLNEIAHSPESGGAGRSAAIGAMIRIAGGGGPAAKLVLDALAPDQGGVE